MDWSLEDAIEYYRSKGAPGNQTALVNLLREVQQEQGNAISLGALRQIAAAYGLKSSFLQAIIRRYPSLRLENTHCLQLCGGPNCSRRGRLAAFVEKTYGEKPAGFRVETTGCLRMCGQGPNIKWDGILYNHADEALLQSLIEGTGQPKND